MDLAFVSTPRGLLYPLQTLSRSQSLPQTPSQRPLNCLTLSETLPPFPFWSQSEPVAVSVSETNVGGISDWPICHSTSLEPTLKFLPAWSVPSSLLVILVPPNIQAPLFLVAHPLLLVPSSSPAPPQALPSSSDPLFHLILPKPGNPPKPFDSSAPPWFVVPSIPLVCQPSDSTGFLIPPALSIITLTLPWTYAVPQPYITLAPLGSSFPLASFSSLLPAGSATVFLAPSSTSVFLPSNST